MSTFQGSGFSVELPDDAKDVSSYAFSFPELGDFSPLLTIRCERGSQDLDLATHVREERQALSASVEDFNVVNELTRSRGTWNYVVSVVEWGPAPNRIRQKQLFVHVPGETPRLYTLAGTDLAENFERSEPVFDEIIRTFTPNDIQAV